MPMFALSSHRDSGQGGRLSVNQDDDIQSQASPTITLVDQDLEEPAAQHLPPLSLWSQLPQTSDGSECLVFWGCMCGERRFTS